MKATFLVFVLGLIAGAFALHYYQQHEAMTVVHSDGTTTTATTTSPSSTATATTTARPSVMDQARDTAASARDALSDKLVEWHLTPAEIRDDLSRTGQVVRAKARVAGQNIAAATANGRVVAVIKAKYTLDKDLSARAIDVDADAGQVTLRGKVASPELVAKAIGLALDTEGVLQVTSLLTVQP